MARPVIPFELTWLDRSFRKSFDVLPPAKKAACQARLAELIEALKDCDHPVKDLTLKEWRPTPYYVANFKMNCHLVEYRLAFEGLRVIACFFDGKPTILLAAATLNHDHEGLQRLLREHGRKFTFN